MTEQTRKCNQQDCDEPAAFRFTWPGHDEATICQTHAAWMRAVTQAMGGYVQLIPLERLP